MWLSMDEDEEQHYGLERTSILITAKRRIIQRTRSSTLHNYVVKDMYHSSQLPKKVCLLRIYPHITD